MLKNFSFSWVVSVGGERSLEFREILFVFIERAKTFFGHRVFSQTKSQLQDVTAFPSNILKRLFENTPYIF